MRANRIGKDWEWREGSQLLLQTDGDRFRIKPQAARTAAELCQLGQAIIDALRDNYFGEVLCRFAIDVARQDFPHLLKEEPVYGPTDHDSASACHNPPAV